MLIDMHVYSTLSGGVPLEESIADAREAGLDAILVADRARSGQNAQKAALREEGEFPVFVGVEIATREGDAILVMPELEPFMTREEWRQLDALDKPTLAEVVQFAAAEGGVVLLAHPYDRNRKRSPRDRMFAMTGLAGVGLATVSADDAANEVALESVSRGSVPAFGGTADKRRPRPDGTRHVTLLAGQPRTQAAFVAAIRGGNFWAVEIVGARDGARQGHGGRPDRDDRGARGDRGGRDDRGARGDRGGRDDRGPRGDRGGRDDRGARGDRGGRDDRGPRGDRGGRDDRGPRGDRGERDEHAPRPEREDGSSMAGGASGERARFERDGSGSRRDDIPEAASAEESRSSAGTHAVEAPAGSGPAVAAPSAPANVYEMGGEAAPPSGDGRRRRRRRRGRGGAGGAGADVAGGEGDAGGSDDAGESSNG